MMRHDRTVSAISVQLRTLALVDLLQFGDCGSAEGGAISLRIGENAKSRFSGDREIWRGIPADNDSNTDYGASQSFGCSG